MNIECTDPAREQVPTPCLRSARLQRHNPVLQVLPLNHIMGFVQKGGPFWGPKRGGVSVLRRHAQRASPSADSLFFRVPPPFNQPLMYIWGTPQKPGFWGFPQNTSF
jgi:hypothetical protein